MPEAPTIVAPAPPARPAAAGAPSAVPASSGEIHVTPRGLSPNPTPEPKPGGAKAKLFEKLGVASLADLQKALAAVSAAASAVQQLVGATTVLQKAS